VFDTDVPIMLSTLGIRRVCVTYGDNCGNWVVMPF